MRTYEERKLRLNSKKKGDLVYVKHVATGISAEAEVVNVKRSTLTVLVDGKEIAFDRIKNYCQDTCFKKEYEVYSSAKEMHEINEYNKLDLHIKKFIRAYPEKKFDIEKLRKLAEVIDKISE